LPNKFVILSEAKDLLFVSTIGKLKVPVSLCPTRRKGKNQLFSASSALGGEIVLMPAPIGRNLETRPLR
jgi:hypothetical protein